MEKSASSGIKVWFWSRDDPGVPLAIRNGWDRIMPSEIWGWPEAGFPLDSCDYVSHFDAHQIVFDLTFCVSVSSWVAFMDN
jgi:hypothetical protein